MRQPRFWIPIATAKPGRRCDRAGLVGGTLWALRSPCIPMESGHKTINRGATTMCRYSNRIELLENENGMGNIKRILSKHPKEATL